MSQEIGIDTRTAIQRSFDKFKNVGECAGIVAKETLGCVLVMTLKIAVVIVIFLGLMAIVGVGK